MMTNDYVVGGVDKKEVKNEDELGLLPFESQWSEEHECVPLKQRLQLLRTRAVSDNHRDAVITSDTSPVIDDDAVKKEDDLCGSLGFHSDGDGSQERSNSASCERMQHGTVHTTKRSPFPTKSSEYSGVYDSEDFLEDLDNVVLRERQRMLLSRSSLELGGSTRQAMEDDSSGLSTSSFDMILQDTGIASNGNETFGIRSGSFGGSTAGAPTWTNQRQGPKLVESQKRSNGSKGSCKTLNTLALPLFPNVKVEPSDEELEIQNKDALASPCASKQKSVKSELVNSSEVLEDIIDHMILGDRMRLLASRNAHKTIVYETFETGNDYKQPTSSECSKPLIMKRPRKRRKTVTNSVETALEEDAPGLLQVLVEKGVLVDEIKLFGESKGDEALDESLVEESFSELEEVITKIFSERHSLLKFAPIRCARGDKSSYCLACLISLVEQARYLCLRKWPVEWGWCRDLQSFIFVFEKHNRIVLERPEYGYATYFFELVDALPVQWQIKRLVTAMKLTSCSRLTLIENRALTVGDDLTEAEARVLMEYGWIPDSGLGTMLNYCDRVVHDRKNESDSSEWRSKIGKLLTDGYNGGTIVPKNIPKKVAEYGVGQIPQIKLEQ